MLRCLLIVIVLLPATRVVAGEVGPVPAEVKDAWELDDFYEKYLEVGGLPVLGSRHVSDAAIREAAWIVERLLGDRRDILRAMAHRKTRLVVMAYNEYTTDVPEHAGLKPRVYWDRRARGLGATPEAPAVSCAEENLLGHPNDPYWNENICIHEFAHAIHAMGMPDVDATFDERLRAAYASAMEAGLWEHTYAASNPEEYWAEAVQSWFDDNRQDDALHNHVNTRAELRTYDPGVASLCAEVFGDGNWRYQKPRARAAPDRVHLSNVEFDELPAFRWRDEAIPDRPVVLVQTTLGDIELELDARKAPLTVANFLHHVQQGHYGDGQFYRALTPENQRTEAVPIEVIQASISSHVKQEATPPIALERTNETGMRHRDGTVSMAREATPDSAVAEFFICIGDQPELDFGGKRNPDGQGFAAFGHVSKGMDVVRAIQAAAKEGERLQPPIRIQRAIRRN